ncbi:hypothetical protein [Streptomyces curacoi]|uniref:Uncharacterized protein n=1 Tax=Streptomyces curacoi TaxID=146536 RepID=A0A124GZQ7_9ACTN|nr:hypothetical protein [Streptomyces curacoi]KUM73306.1 hypothetical protein AQI70_21270 [Streptomyces curacoi]
MSTGGRRRATAQVLCLIVLIGLYLFSGFADVHGQARTHLSVAIAVLTGLFTLLNRPELRPPASEAVPRSASVAFTGRLLIVVVWIVQAFLFGLSGYLVSTQFQKPPGFHGSVALLAAAGQVLALVALCARNMAGFRPDPGFSFGFPGVLRHVLDRAALVVLAGYASTLPDVVKTVVTWVPDQVHGFFASLAPAWLAWPLTVAVCAVWFLAVLVVESLLQVLIASALGPDNSLGQWLGEHAPVTYRRTDVDVTFDFNFRLIRILYYNSVQGWAFVGRLLLEMRYSSSFGPLGRGPTRRQRERLQRYERPLTDEEKEQLPERVAAVAVEAAPPEWRLLILEYRAAAEHEEIQLRVDPADRWAWAWDEAVEEEPTADGAGGEDSPEEESPGGGDENEGRSTNGDLLELPDFPERAALRRLREASYSAEHGVGYVLVMNIEKNDPSTRPYYGDGPWRITYQAMKRDPMPRWRQPPTARQYRRDLRRFPTVRGRRPFWLRNQVKRIG